MGETQKLMIAVVGVFVVGFLVVGASKDQTNEEKEAASQIRSLVAMQEMANQKCPKLIQSKTGSQGYFPSKTEVPIKRPMSRWNVGEAGDNFKNRILSPCISNWAAFPSS